MKKPILSMLLALFMLTVLLSGCAPASTPAMNALEPLPGEGFAIYLLAQAITPNELLQVDIDSLNLAEQPILSIKDIVSYSKLTHEIELTAQAYRKMGQLEVPTSGIPFVACVDRQPIYAGAFWIGYSSQSYQGIAIDTLFAQLNHPIKITLGYPESPELFLGDDPRSDPRIMESLESAGKLK